jgi:lipid-A-disaccharide synthase
VERHLPIFVQTAQELRKTFPEAEFVLFRPSELPETLYQPFLAGTPWLRLVYDPHFTQRKKLSLAITVSGTASLENTLLGIPMVVMYKLSSLTYAIAKQLIRVPFVAIPNILAGKALIPELLQRRGHPAEAGRGGTTAARKSVLQSAHAQ